MWQHFVLVLSLLVGIALGQSWHSNTYQGRRNRATVTFPDDLGLKDDDHRHHNYQYQYQENHLRNGSGRRLPVDLARDLIQYNVTDLLLNFVDDSDYDGDDKLFIQNRFGDDGSQERNAAVMPKEAACMPELTTVKIATSDDPSILYIPQCTRVERCGGCCSHSLLSCQPQEIETLNFKVIKTQYTGSRKLKLVAKELIQVERHTKCKCDCKVKASDCNKFQEYKKSECRCACINMDEEKKCLKNNTTRLWDPESCNCRCREQLECSTGSYFDQFQCRCRPYPMRRRYAQDNEPVPPPEPDFDE